MKKSMLVLIVCLMIVCMAIAGVLILAIINGADEHPSKKYSIDDISNMLFLKPEDTYDLESVNTENLDNFNYILNAIDRKAGQGEYYIHSIYVCDLLGPSRPESYVIKIVLKDYVDEFYSNEDASLNPYAIMFDNSADDLGKVSDFYDSFLAARDYEKDFKEAMEKEFADFQVNIQYNYLDYNPLNRVYSGSWEKELDRLNFSMNEVIVFVPYGTDPDAVAGDFQNKGILKDFYIKVIWVAVLKEGVDMKNIDDKANVYSDYVDEDFGYRADSSGKLE